MTEPLGFDLNGLRDFVAEGEENADAILKDLGVHSSFVRLAITGREHWIGGVQASLAPHGKGPGWGQIGSSDNRVFLSDILEDLASGDVSETEVGALHGFLDGLMDEPRDGVFAVPDVPEFDEASRDRLLRLLTPVTRLRPTLLWRPIAAVLGYTEEFDDKDPIHPEDGMRVAVMSLVSSGVQLADAKLVRESWNNTEIWVPEREQAGTGVGGHCNGVSLAWEVAQSMSTSLGVDAETVASSLNAPWLRCVGEKPGFELFRRANRSWIKVPESVAPEISVTPADFSETFRERLLRADALIVEGPMIGNSTWVEAILAASSWPADRPVHRARNGLVAKGCLVAGQRFRVGAPVYYDFLPQLELNALVEGEAQFVELIPGNQRLRGGTFYRGGAPGEFAIGRGASRLTFFLFKEDYEKGRRAEIDLPETAENQHRIQISVEQSPGQGFARVRIASDTFDPLRALPLELDWSRMSSVDETREEILESLSGETGLSYPDAYTRPGHPLHWHPEHYGGELITLLQEYLDEPLILDSLVNQQSHDKLKALRARFSRSESPAYVAVRMGLECDDAGNFRALGGDGSVPTSRNDFVVPDNAAETLGTVLTKVGNELEQLLHDFGTDADPALLRDVVGFATWCFWICPSSVTEFLLEIYEGRSDFSLHHVLLREGVGRAVHSNEELGRYFSAIATKLHADGSLTAPEFSALSRVLGGCPDGASRLPKESADLIVQETAHQLADENELPRTRAYKRRFKTFLLMLAALLRHRHVRPDFLDPEDHAAQHLLMHLQEAIERNQRFVTAEERAAKRSHGETRYRHLASARRFTNNSEILAELVNLIHLEGSDPNIIRRIEELEDDD